MKHLYKFSLFLLAFLLPVTALAHDFEVDGIYYNINGDEATVTYKGTSYSEYNEYSGSVTIPATFTHDGITYFVIAIGEDAFCRCTGLTSIDIPNSVTSIGDRAFSNCKNLISVTIPNSITSIGSSAFRGCVGLTSITISNSVTTIGDGAFRNCTGLTSITVAGGNPKYDSRGNCNAIIETATNTLVVGCKNTNIPNSVTSIGNGAFEQCTGLTSIEIPNSVTSIGDGAFSICSSLTSVTIPNSVTAIGESAFEGCSGLTSVTIGNSVTTIGDWAFCNCYSLTSIDIPNSVTTIGSAAFIECSGLTSIAIPNSVTTIGDGAFRNCTGLTSITVAGGNPKYDSRNNCNAIIETASNTLILGCINTVIPNSVTTIGRGAFYGCYNNSNWNPMSITIPNSVTSIGDGAFYGCSGLTSIIIPNSVTSIGGSAFYGCSGLTSVIIGNSVTSIGDGAFYRCDNLSEVFCLPLTPLTIDESAFYPCCSSAIFYVPDIALDAYKVAEYWKDFINIIGIPYTFEVDGTSYHATTMNTASVIANNDEGSLYSGDVVIPDSVTYAGMTFAVTGIENNAFDGCFELTSITIPNSVETIGEQAFQGCTVLTSVTIGSGVTAIGAKAFNYCNALATVKCLGTVPPVMASSDCFSTAAYNRAQLLVPRQFVDAYTAADYWYKFVHIDGWGSAGRGDIDGDGEVSIRDVTRMIDAILTGEHEGVYFESADLNNNGRLDIGDVTTIIDMLLNGN